MAKLRPLTFTRGDVTVTEADPCGPGCDGPILAMWRYAADQLYPIAEGLARDSEDGKILGMLQNMRQAAADQAYCYFDCTKEIRAWVSLAALTYRYIQVWAHRDNVRVDFPELGVPPLIPGMPDGSDIGTWFDRLEGLGKVAAVVLGFLLIHRLMGRSR